MSDCLHPRRAWIAGKKICKDGVESPNLVFKQTDALAWFWKHSPFRFVPSMSDAEALERMAIDLPCGHCPNCVAKARRDMSTRLCHEASMHDVACFITLTYDDEHIPLTDSQEFERGVEPILERGYKAAIESDCIYPTLLPRDVQLFMKRLRRRLDYHYGIKGLRYFAVGEYGGRTRRPHYHIIIFGWTPNDKEVLKVHKGKPVYISDEIAKLWTYGFHTLSDVNAAVAKYAARYTVKKLVVEDRQTKAICPSFNLQSTRQGAIGSKWLDKHYLTLDNGTGCTSFRCGSRIVKAAIPAYYFRRLRRVRLPFFLHLRDERLCFVNSQKVKEFEFDADLRTRMRDLAAENAVRKAELYRIQVEREMSSDIF